MRTRRPAKIDLEALLGGQIYSPKWWDQVGEVDVKQRKTDLQSHPRALTSR